MVVIVKFATVVTISYAFVITTIMKKVNMIVLLIFFANNNCITEKFHTSDNF